MFQSNPLTYELNLKIKCNQCADVFSVTCHMYACLCVCSFVKAFICLCKIARFRLCCHLFIYVICTKHVALLYANYYNICINMIFCVQNVLLVSYLHSLSKCRTSHVKFLQVTCQCITSLVYSRSRHIAS